MSKYKYALAIMGITMLIILAFVLIVFNVKKADTQRGLKIIEDNNQEDNTKEDNFYNDEVIKTGNIEEVVISPNAILIFNKYYNVCGHTIIERKNATKEVNMNKQELQELYKDWDIKKFTNNEIQLYKEYGTECGEHYVVKEKDGVIAIYKITATGDLDFIEDTEISIKYLPEIDIKNLQEGVTVVGKEELNAYIENFE